MNHLLPAATKLGQGNIFTSVCQEFCLGGCLPQCMLGYTPPLRAGADTPQEQTPLQDQTPPQSRHAPKGRPPAKSRHPQTRHPPRPDTPQEQTPAHQEQTPPKRRPPQEQTHPQSRHPPRADTPLRADTPPPHTVNVRPVRILLECILVFRKYYHEKYIWVISWTITLNPSAPETCVAF